MSNEVEIIGYATALADRFKQLNVEWLEKYFVVEPYDDKVLSHPQQYIIDEGGVIIFAKLNGEVVGTCALQFVSEGVYELAKMAVTQKAQGHQVGKLLGIAVIEKAKAMGAKKLVLESNDSLTPAITLYEKLGFVHQPRDFSQSNYQRANVYMELVL